MFTLKDFFDLAGSLICHQLPDRTLMSGGMLLPVCARDTGIYAGIFTGVLYLLLMRRFKAQKPPGTPTAVLLCILMLPMILDGLLSYTGFIRTNNTVRLFTGALFGFSIPFFLIPAAHFSIHGNNERPVLRNAAELVPAYAFLFVLCELFLNGLVPYAASGMIYVTGLLSLLARLSYTVLARMGRFSTSPLYAATIGVTLCILAFLFVLSTFILQPIKSVLLGG